MSYYCATNATELVAMTQVQKYEALGLPTTPYTCKPRPGFNLRPVSIAKINVIPRASIQDRPQFKEGFYLRIYGISVSMTCAHPSVICNAINACAL